MFVPLKFYCICSAQNSGGTTATGPNGDLELTIDVEDLNDNDPVFQPASKCKEMENGTTGRKYTLNSNVKSILMLLKYRVNTLDKVNA